jgi:hypothetical protein
MSDQSTIHFFDQSSQSVNQSIKQSIDQSISVCPFCWQNLYVAVQYICIQKTRRAAFWQSVGRLTTLTKSCRLVLMVLFQH